MIDAIEILCVALSAGWVVFIGLTGAVQSWGRRRSR